MKKVLTATLLVLTIVGAAACGGSQSVSSDPASRPTPTPPTTPTPVPTPKTWTVRTTFSSLHVYANGDPFFHGEIYCTFAVNDQVEYSAKITTGNPSDVDLSNYGIGAITITAAEGEPMYIYSDCYDQDPNNNGSDPIGTVNTGWYVGDGMQGYHTIAAQNPYYYNLTYRLELLN
jgi:hypothetical protein